MEPEGSLPHSHAPANCPCPEPARSSTFPHIALPEGPSSHLRLGPCHHDNNASSGCRMEELPPIWSVTANILNKQSRTANTVWSSSSGVGRSAKNSPPQKRIVLRYSLHSWNPNSVSSSQEHMTCPYPVPQGRIPYPHTVHNYRIEVSLYSSITPRSAKRFLPSGLRTDFLKT